ncbi:uncharacterized protein HRG_10792 [Hirsutella rhossiliensis]|uniref:Uncharacterized protein n=1 Tax=Hirsutella rhossiliensis TaxID=111463 RepID=A0A9P8MMM4_9HYPO|nr:uncharacterized protein HRG_10792 [Hirsutella rhossiliensis]KAH0958097.1 hypothetical protein HRG_10792 [Hirsutella rhossiliensis]
MSKTPAQVVARAGQLAFLLRLETRVASKRKAPVKAFRDCVSARMGDALDPEDDDCTQRRGLVVTSLLVDLSASTLDALCRLQGGKANAPDAESVAGLVWSRHQPLVEDGWINNTITWTYRRYSGLTQEPAALLLDPYTVCQVVPVFDHEMPPQLHLASSRRATPVNRGRTGFLQHDVELVGRD